MRKPLQVTVIVAITATLASSAFAVVAAVSSANGRTKPAAERIEPAASNSTTTAPPSAGSAMVAEVAIAEFAFGPPDLDAAVGSTVTWTNSDDVTHNVFTANGALASPDLERGDTYSVTFDEPGTIDYYCDIHQYMRGTITVTP